MASLVESMFNALLRLWQDFEQPLPLVPAVIKVTLQKYVQNKYKPGTNPCAELRYIVTERVVQWVWDKELVTQVINHAPLCSAVPRGPNSNLHVLSFKNNRKYVLDVSGGCYSCFFFKNKKRAGVTAAASRHVIANCTGCDRMWNLWSFAQKWILFKLTALPGGGGKKKIVEEG